MKNAHPLLKKIMILAVVVVLIMGCGGLNAATPASDNDTVGTMVASTLQAFQALATPTMISSATSFPVTVISPTLPPPATITSTPPPSATRIHFSTGATQTSTTGTIQPGQSIFYVVRAEKSQPLLVSLGSPNNDVTLLSIVGANGAVLLPQSAGNLNHWQGLLPSSQDYYIQVLGGAASQNFTLDVTAVARVQFGAGETKATLKGLTVDGFGVAFVVYAAQGQKMDVILSVQGDSAALSIWGFTDGQPYARADNGVQDFSLKLPSTQDYIVMVVPRAGQTVEYSVTIRIK